MGPVSFEAIEVGVTRTEALSNAGRLKEAGLSVTLMEPDQRREDGVYRVLVRSTELKRALAVLEIANGGQG